MSRHACAARGLRQRGALVATALIASAYLASGPARADEDADAGAPRASESDAGAPPLVTWGAALADPDAGAGGPTGDGGAAGEADAGDDAASGADGGVAAAPEDDGEDDDEWDEWDDESDEPPTDPIVWRADWPRFSTADWLLTGAGAAVTVAAAIVAPQPRHVFGGYAFDEQVRSTLRLSSTNLRFVARDASDILVSLEATWPFFVDAAITTWWYHHSPDAAAQMAAVNAQAITVITGLQGITNTIASRERPYARDCDTPTLPAKTVECEGNVRYRSFFSGHSAFSFTAAGLICTNHMKLGLFGGGAADIAACVLAYSTAAATGTLRIMGDMHYATDVLTGAVLGTVVGIAVPLWHYRTVTPSDERPRHLGSVRIIPVGAGVGVGGSF